MQEKKGGKEKKRGCRGCTRGGKNAGNKGTAMLPILSREKKKN
jgi:hypothetical protein